MPKADNHDPFAWLEQRSNRDPIRALAGHTLEIDSRAWLHGDEGEPVRWTVEGQTSVAPILRWMPRSPGFRAITLTAPDGRKSLIKVSVGLVPSDLIDRRSDLDYYFCLVARRSPTVHFIPLLEGELADADAASELAAEDAAHHPAFAKFLREHSRIYRQEVLPQLPVAAKMFSDGLYAVFPTQVVSLGSAAPIIRATEAVSDAISRMAHAETGRSKYLRTIEQRVRELKPLEYKYLTTAQYPPAIHRGAAGPRAEALATRAVSGVLGALGAIVTRLGGRMGRQGATSVITFNSSTGMLTTRFFDLGRGFSRQATSGNDPLQALLGNLARKIPGLPGRSGSSARDSLVGDRSQWAMDNTEKKNRPGSLPEGSRKPAHERYDTKYPLGKQGDTYSWHKVGKEDVLRLELSSRDKSSAPDAGTPDSSADGGTRADPEKQEDVYADLRNAGFSDTQIEEYKQKVAAAKREEEKAEEEEKRNRHPQDAETPNPEADDDWSAPVSVADLTVFTRGGGYTDPRPDMDPEPSDGAVHVLHGGGFTDPSPEDGGAGGFDIWGGYNPPVDGSIDPTPDPTAGDYGSGGSGSLRRVVGVTDGVRIETLSGETARGVSANGLIAAILVE